MPLRLLTPAGSYDLSAIMRQAWAAARAALVPPRPIRGFTPAPRPTLREAFKEALHRAWDLARGQRACHQHHTAAVAETARRSALPVIEREVLGLRDARAIAPMTDEMMSLRGLLEKSADADVLREMIGLPHHATGPASSASGATAQRRSSW